MPLLTRKKQLAVVRQTGTDLVSSGLDSGANASVVVLDAQGALDIERIQRNLLRDTLTSVKDLVGQRAVTFTYGIEMKGTAAGTHASGAPGWGLHLEGAGFRQVEVQSIPIGAITATPGPSTTFRHGETVTQTTTGATARVVMDTHDGSAEVYIEKASIVGTPNGSDTWTGQDSGAVATPSGAPADEGWAWYPITDPIKSITFDGTGLTTALSVGDLIRDVTTGATGIVSEAASVSGDTVVKFRPVRGLFGAGNVVERVNPSADSDIGTLDDPTGETFVDWPPLSMRLYEDGTALTIRAARANVAFQLEVNRQARMDFTYRGVLADADDKPMITGVNYDNGTPPIWETSTIGFARNDRAAEDGVDAEVAPCLATFSLDMGVQLADRKCAGADKGLLEIYGSDRDATGRMNPEATLESDISWIGRVKDGEVSRLRMTVGGLDGNRFTLALPGIQYTGSTTNDEEGRMVRDLPFRATGGDLWDLVDSPTKLTSIGGNNEVVIVYHTA